jgi:hypothetical protein
MICSMTDATLRLYIAMGWGQELKVCRVWSDRRKEPEPHVGVMFGLHVTQERSVK